MIAVREGRDAFLRTVAQLTSERAAAREIVANLRASSSELWDGDVPGEWRTAGFVQELTSVASEILESNPRESLAFAQLALAIATSIPSGTYPAPVQPQIEGAAWKEIGAAHRYIGEYDAALRAYDAAHRAYSASNALAHDDAVIDLASAIVLADLTRYEEALELLASVDPVLRAFDDHKHVVQVRQMTANIYYFQGRLQEARAELEASLEEIPFDEPYTRGAFCSTLGLIYGQLGRIQESLEMLHKARGMFADLGMTGEVNRTEWALAGTVLATGDLPKAIQLLRSVRNTFLSLSMADDSGLAGLDLADALIANRQMDEARQIVEDVLGEFVTKKLNHRAITALAYLRDVLPTASRPQRAVDHVRKYLKQLRSPAAPAFLPLPEE
jgi:tetratricopeptide (TPR) repeat protein